MYLYVYSIIRLLLQPIFTYIVQNEPAATPAAFCGLLLQNSESDPCPANDPRFEYTIELPEPSEEVSITYYV